MRRRRLGWGIPVAALALAVGAVAAVGGLAPRDDLGAGTVEPGGIVATDRATVILEGVEADAESVIATLTVVNHLDRPLRLDALARLADAEGVPSAFASTTAGGASTLWAQPGVEDVVTIAWSLDRPLAADARVELLDARAVPRDETGFGLGAGMVDERVAAIARIAS